ncbi:MAG: hypothetical protein Q7T63_11020, partial [Burkholderiaceae bacterium]|nr:hypothetical protein [Burkholderiaceae bacterium]
DQIAGEHDEHERHIAHLRGLIVALAAQPAAARGAAALTLYRETALFVADNFRHMHVEETAHNAVLWARYTDAELVGIHGALLASIPPQEMMFALRWLVPFMNPEERSAMLGDMREHAPAPAFAAALEMVRPLLSESEWGKLARDLNLPA